MGRHGVDADRALTSILHTACQLQGLATGPAPGVIVLLDDADLLVPSPSRRLQPSLTEVDHGLLRALQRLEDTSENKKV